MTVNPYEPPDATDLPSGNERASRMTSTAYAQGCANGMVCGLLVLPVIGSVYWLLSANTNLSRTTVMFFTFMIPFAGSFLAGIYLWMRGIQRRGVLLIDCCGHPGRRQLLLTAVLLFALSVSNSTIGRTTFGQLGPLLPISFSVFLSFIATGRFSVYEAGLWLYHGLLPWDKIADYSWTTDNTLIVKTTDRFSLSRGAIPVPAECVEDVTRLLRQYKKPAE